jgi:uncharacterized protein
MMALVDSIKTSVENEKEPVVLTTLLSIRPRNDNARRMFRQGAAIGGQAFLIWCILCGRRYFFNDSIRFRMPSNHELFFQNDRFAVVGHTHAGSFPKLTYQGLKNLGKTVYPVDPSLDEVAGDKAYQNLKALPEKVDGVILEVPKEETRQWVAEAAEVGIKEIWIHMQRDTEEALALAREKGLNVRTGTCAVMYVTPGVTFHSLHKWIMQLLGKY